MDSTESNSLNVNTTVTFRQLNAANRLISVTKRNPSDPCLPCYGLLPEGDSAVGIFCLTEPS